MSIPRQTEMMDASGEGRAQPSHTSPCLSQVKFAAQCPFVLAGLVRGQKGASKKKWGKWGKLDLSQFHTRADLSCREYHHL